MKIKNFTVTAKTVRGQYKGLVEYCRYLVNDKHKNHAKTAISPLVGDITSFISRTMAEVTALDMKNKNGKGGRPMQGYAQSFNFILPKNTIKPTSEQWRAIGKDLGRVLVENLSITPSEASQAVFMNIHDQDNPHLNMLVSKVINGERKRSVDQKALLSKLKTQFNKSVLEHCNYDYRSYEPTATQVGKRVDLWKHQYKLLTRATEQFKALAKYIDEDNKKRIKSTKNRIIKTLGDLDLDMANKACDDIATTLDSDFNEQVQAIKDEIAAAKQGKQGLSSTRSSKKPKK